MEIPAYFDIIEDAKKYFFAEDIMSYFMISSNIKPYFRIPVTKRCFRLIPRAFNDLMETAVCFLYSRISVFNTFRSFQSNEMITTGTFLLFAHRLENRYFCDKYNPQKFLYFCVYLVYIAISFHQAGKTDIPRAALYYIVRVMNSFDVPEAEFWNGLSIAAFGYIKIAFKCSFVKMSDFESMKIQFVVNESFKGHTVDGNVEGSSADAVQKNDLVKLSADLKSKISMFDDHSDSIKSSQSMSDIEKLSALYEENINRELSSDCNSTEPKESLENVMDERSVDENNLDTKCRDSIAVSSEFERKKCLQRKYRAFQELCGLMPVSDFHENSESLFNANQDFVSKGMQSSTMDTEVSRSLKSESDVTSLKSECFLKTVDFDISDKFVMDMLMGSGTDIELYGETHEDFISSEDYFNSTFDILSVVHSMSTSLGTEILDIERLY